MISLFARFLRSLCNPQQGANLVEPDQETVREVEMFQNDLLVYAQFYPTRNMGGAITPEYLILHYTANGSTAGTVKHFQSPHSDASAHLVIGRDGELVQMVPFTRKAWHAGKSAWQGVPGLNERSIGIEIVNWGKLRYSKGKLYSWADTEIAKGQAIEMPNKDGKVSWWHRYTPEQVEVCANVSRELVRHYKLLDVLGHADVSPGRKVDPGPAFPLDDVRVFCYSDAEDWRAFIESRKNKDGK